MPARIMIVSRSPAGAFPRWGYLDKYAVNEYLARAFALTTLLAFMAMGAMQLVNGRPRSVPLSNGHRLPNPVREIAVIQPPPSVVPGRVKPMGGSPARVRVGRITPVPAPALELEFTPGAAGSGTGPAAEASGGLDALPLDAEIVAPKVSVWPSPDDIVVVEKEPQLISMQTPAYPEIAREAGMEGTVLVRVLVDTQGTVRERMLLESIRGLDEAALAAAATAVFRPALQQERPVAVWVVLPIEFRLHD
jgi:TonB family protein